MALTTKNLGLVKLVHVSTLPPTNINMIWYDDNIGIKRHKYYDTILSAWVLLGALAKRGIITPLDGINYSWDIDDNLIITHSLGAEDIYVAIKDNTKISKLAIPYKTIDSNSVIVYIGERLSGEFCIICL